MAYALQQLAHVSHAELIGKADTTVEYLLTDSRQLHFAHKTLFFALKTKSNNGHRYINQLYRKGVNAFVVQRDFDSEQFPNASFLKVDDVLQALQKIAAMHRSSYFYPVVGITGSNGKTVVKEWLFQLLQPYKNVVRSPRSYNSQIGVPLSLWQMNAGHEVALIEAGISHPDEMARLQNMIRPNIGIFTNLGAAHDLGFLSRKQKAREKAKLFKQAEKVIYCADYELIDGAVREIIPQPERLISWTLNQKKGAVHITQENECINFELGKKQYTFLLPMADIGTVENSINAIFCALELGLSTTQIAAQLAKLKPIEMRLQERKGMQGNLLINDFYNSDPESVRLALNLLKQQPNSREKIAIISDFEELGKSQSDAAYRQVVDALNQMPLTKVICVGNNWINYFAGIVHEKVHLHATAELPELLRKLAPKNTAILLKGARSFAFEKVAALLQAQIHQTWLEIDLSAMAHNLRHYRAQLLPNTKTMAMVKALSYGAGTVEVARWLSFNQVDYLAVAYVDEGITLRKGGIDLPILVMNPDAQAFSRMITYKLEPELYSLEILEAFSEALVEEYAGAQPFPIHLKLETGMHRLGIEHEDLPEILKKVKQNPKMKVASVFSHLAASDMSEHDMFTKQQIEDFAAMASLCERELGYSVLKHMANTAAVARFQDAQFNMVRLGIGLYGVAHNHKEQQYLKPVSRWFTRISQIKNVAIGDSVGYGRSFVATRPTTIATLPVGYADGYFRILSNGMGRVFVNGRFAPVVGRVCMDMLMVDITAISAAVGDHVELMGENVSALEMANAAQTIPYEIFTHISSRVPRIYTSE